jgi:chaperonin GroES
MKLCPLQDRVLIRRVDPDKKTTGGILIPDNVQEKPMEGDVLAVGPGARDKAGTLQPLDIKTGDRVLFAKWSGTEVKLDGEELMIMKESDVMGVVDQPVAVKNAA